MKKINKSLKLGFIWYVFSLMIYWILLYIFRKFEILSTFYHFLLVLFPLALVFTKREEWQSIGFRRGNIKEGACWLILFTALCIGKILLNVYFLDKSLDFELSYPLFTSVILAPITEEMFFRGFFQEKFSINLATRYAGYIAVVLASALFMIIHLPRFSIGMYTVSNLGGVFLLGIIFGFAYKEGNSILWPISLHAIWNLTVSVVI